MAVMQRDGCKLPINTKKKKKKNRVVQTFILDLPVHVRLGGHIFIHEWHLKWSSGLDPGVFYLQQPAERRVIPALMEGRELQTDNKRLETFPKLPVWIIEYVWAHKIIDIQKVVDPSYWPDVDSQPLSLEDSWRLRVSSACMFSIVKNRDVEHFDKVIGFLEATYRLLPRLVAPIKHMKIMFGLKTMVIMWMLREGRRMVDTVFKVMQFFPSKLPEYQDHCSKHEMFLMRKNHLDFKTLAQALATDKDKLEDYVKKHMEEQYGEHYAQKVEDRLLHYLHKLETVLPGDTYVDKILKKSSPVTDEEKLLLEVITCDSTTIATTLKKLLHCDSVSCCQAPVSQSSEYGQNEMENFEMSGSVLHGRSLKCVINLVEGKTPEPEVFMGQEESAGEVSKDGPLLLKIDRGSHVGRQPQTKEDGNVVERVEEDKSDKEKDDTGQRSRKPSSSPHFCSKHKRWVKTILQECPEECSEELLLQATVSSSPLLFQSSSSTSSSQDLTPSNLISCPPDHQRPSSQTTAEIQTSSFVQPPSYEQASPEDKRSSGLVNNNPQMEAPSLPCASRDALPAVWSPVVRLVDIASVRRISPTIKRLQSPPKEKQAASTSLPQMLISSRCHTLGNNHFIFSQSKGVDASNSVDKTAPTFTSCQLIQRPSSRLSRKYRRACSIKHLQTSGGFNQDHLAEQVPAAFHINCLSLPNFTVADSSVYDATTSTNQPGTLSSVCTANKSSSAKSSRQVVHQIPIKCHVQTHSTSLFQTGILSGSTVTSSSSNSDCLAVRLDTSRPNSRISLSSRAVFLPSVSLTRLSTQDCFQMTKGRCSARCVEPVLQGINDALGMKDEEDGADSSFDPNTLYSSQSSGSDTEDSAGYDPDYKPCIKKKRLLLEYEAAQGLNHM